MIKIADISFQSKTAPAPARSAEPILTGATEAKSLFDSVLGQSQELGMTAVTTETDVAAIDARGLVNNALSEGEGLVNNALSEGQGSVNNALNEGQGLVNNALSEGKGLVNNALSEGKGSVNNALSERQGSVNSALSEGQRSVNSALSEGQRSVNNALSEGQGSLNNVLSEGQGSLNNVLSEGPELVTSTTAPLVNNTVSSVSEARDSGVAQELNSTIVSSVINTDTTKTDSKILVDNALAEPQKLGLTVSETVGPKVLLNSNFSELQESDQKLIQLEDYEPTKIIEEFIPTENGESFDPYQHLFAANLDSNNSDKLVTTDDLTLETDLLVTESANLLGIHYQSVKSGDQAAIETGSKSVSLSELRSIQPESQRSRHAAVLDQTGISRLSVAGDNIADKAIDLDKLSIKQPYNEVVDFDEPVLVDKFEVDKTLALNNAKTASTDIKTESLLVAAKDSSVVSDTTITKSVGHTPISLQSMNGNIELSAIASMGLKTGTLALPAGTLVLRQPGLDQSLGSNISFMINEDIQSANINVKPVELGPVNIQLAVKADHLSVTIAASQVQTRESLESTLPRLREQFASMGFSSVDVNVGDHPSQKQSTDSSLGNGGQSSAKQYQGSRETDISDDARYITPSRVTHNGMLDTFA